MPPTRCAYVLIVITLFVLTACDSIASLPIFPTPTPTPIPSPTPTRADEIVIPFQSLASNHLSPLTADSPGGEPLLMLEDKPAIESDWDALRLEAPMAHIVRSVEDIEPLGIWLPTEVLTTLAEVDYSVDIAIALIIGLSDSRSDTHIQRVATARRDELTIYGVHYLYNYSLAYDSYPSQVIRISRDDLPFEISSDTVLRVEMVRQQVNP